MKFRIHGRVIPLGMALAAALVLAACGGGGGGYSGPIPTSPSGNGSNQADDGYGGFMAYVKGLIGMTPETTQAADVSKFDPPAKSETGQPVSTP